MLHKDILHSNGSTATFSMRALQVAICILGANFFLYNTALFDIRLVLRVIAAVILLAVFLLNFDTIKIKRSEIVAIGFLACLLLLHGSEILNLILIMLFILDVRAVDASSLLSFISKAAVFFAIAAAILLMTGVVSNTVNVYQGRTRNYLGFTQPNATALFYACIMCVPFGAKRKTATVLVCCVLCLALFWLTDSRGLLVAVITYFLLYLIVGRCYSSKLIGPVKWIVYLTIIASLCISAILPLFAGSEVDVLLSFRPTYYYSCLNELSITDWILGAGETSVTVDNFYLITVAIYGLPVLAYFAGKMIFAVKTVTASRDSCRVAFFVAMIVYAICETFLLRPETLITLAFWAMVSVKEPEEKSTPLGAR